MRITQAESYDEPRDSISHDWVSRLSAWQMAPLLIPNSLPDPAAYLAGLEPDLLLLTGGDNPAGDTGRERTERLLLDHAVSHDLPVLGVCRGMQKINLYFGGRLHPIEGHVAVAHNISIQPAWQNLFDPMEVVNSFHELGIDSAGLARDLVDAAIDDDGNIEAFHHLRHPVAGMMWHPEREHNGSGDRALIELLGKSGAFWT